MQASLKTRLLVLLLGSVALVWLATAAITFGDAHEELDELLDAHLAQAATLLVSQAGHELEELDDDHAPDLHRYARLLVFQVWDGRKRELRLRSANAPQSPLAGDTPGFSDHTIGQQRWRVFTARADRERVIIHVAEPAEPRDRLARELAFNLLKPLIYALPALALLLWVAVGRGLRPLTVLRDQVAGRGPDKLEPLDLARVPMEAQPLVEQLNALFGRIADSLENERRFTADAAHELRTPVAAIKAQAQVARGAATGTDRVHALDQVIAGCDRAAHLIEQLLTLARLDRAAPLPAAACGLRRAAAEAMATLAPAAVTAGVQLELADGDEIEVSGEPALLQVMARNLIDNAVRYSAPGKTVRVEVDRVAGRPRLIVVDEGPGISPDDLARVRERFYRVVGTGREGTGLGLSIVQRIAELHGATLVLAPGQDGKGLRATVEFARPAA